MTSLGEDIANRIRESGLTIYDDLSLRPELLYDIESLEARLNERLKGVYLPGPVKTRAKKAKEEVALVLGYPIPSSFARTRPRFPGQNLDVYVQKSKNLQIWNEEADATRRYVLIRVDISDIVSQVRVITGAALVEYDRTGTLTSKYQAKRKAGQSGSKLVSVFDTTRMQNTLKPSDSVTSAQLKSIPPVAPPRPGSLLLISVIFERLKTLVGYTVPDPGLLQDRNRGAELHKRICSVLGLGEYADSGQFPDILSQALEVKLQMSPTIDLGLVTPNSTEPAESLGYGLLHCDVRYAIVYGVPRGSTEVLITCVVVSTGEKFFEEFQLFGGLIQNRKLQLPLPASLFDPERTPD